MERRNILTRVLIIVTMIFACFGAVNFLLSRGYSYSKHGISTSPYLVTAAGNAGTVNDNSYLPTVEGAMIQLEYPNSVPYPGMEKFDIMVSNYPANAVFCKVSADFGKTSANAIYLGSENQISYFVPAHIDSLASDTVSFQFYDDNARLIGDSKIAVEYDKEEKQLQIFEKAVKEILPGASDL